MDQDDDSCHIRCTVLCVLFTSMMDMLEPMIIHYIRTYHECCSGKLVHFARMIYTVYHLFASHWSSCLLPKSLKRNI
jgi:hypothetical protein